MLPANSGDESILAAGYCYPAMNDHIRITIFQHFHGKWVSTPIRRGVSFVQNQAFDLSLCMNRWPSIGWTNFGEMRVLFSEAARLATVPKETKDPTSNGMGPLGVSYLVIRRLIKDSFADASLRMRMSYFSR